MTTVDILEAEANAREATASSTLVVLEELDAVRSNLARLESVLSATGAQFIESDSRVARELVGVREQISSLMISVSPTSFDNKISDLSGQISSLYKLLNVSELDAKVKSLEQQTAALADMLGQYQTCTEDAIRKQNSDVATLGGIMQRDFLELNQKVISERAVSGTTEDATPLDLATHLPVDGTACVIQALVVGRKRDGSQAAGYALYIVARREGETSNVIGTPDQPIVDEDDTGWNAVLTNDGANVVVRVTGAAATTVDWSASLFVASIGAQSL